MLILNFSCVFSGWFRNSDQCTVVTLGIGGDISAELALREKHPECRFYGADPNEAYRSLYEQIGKFYPAAVSSQTGVEMQMHMRLANGTYVDVVGKTVAF